MPIITDIDKDFVGISANRMSLLRVGSAAILAKRTPLSWHWKLCNQWTAFTEYAHCCELKSMVHYDIYDFVVISDYNGQIWLCLPDMEIEIDFNERGRRLGWPEVKAGDTNNHQSLVENVAMGCVSYHSALLQSIFQLLLHNPHPLLHSAVHCHLHLEIWTTLCNCIAPSTGTQCKIHFSPIVKTALPPPQWPVVKGLQQEELIVNRSILSIFQVKSLWFKTREKKWGSQNLTKVEPFSLL